MMELGEEDFTLNLTEFGDWNTSAHNCTTDASATNPLLFQTISYSVLFLIAAIGNLTVFISLIRGRHRKSRISLMITHLTIADLLVTFIMIPMEIGWRITVQWTAGNYACKVFVMLRAFGLYLSSNVLVCVSMDRYFAVLYPLKVNDARRRGKMMLLWAWVFSFLCASPQSIVFHVSQHPTCIDFYQCVTFGFFASEAQEKYYNLFCVSAMYFIPLLVIIFAYSCILWEISSKSRGAKEDNKVPRLADPKNGRLRLRRSDMSNIERARARTLRMTIYIVAAFIWCWTPYVVMTLWYQFDRDSATKVDSRIQDALFLMAVSNSCMNPLVYGSYTMNFKGFLCRCLGVKTESKRPTIRSTTTKSTQYCSNRAVPLSVTFHCCNRPGGRAEIDAGRPHSDLYVKSDMLANDDSGVSISYKGRPYHSDPAYKNDIAPETKFFQSQDNITVDIPLNSRFGTPSHSLNRLNEDESEAILLKTYTKPKIQTSR